MSSSGQFYSLVTLNDRVVPGFAGIMRASMMTGEPPAEVMADMVCDVPSVAVMEPPEPSARAISVVLMLSSYVKVVALVTMMG